MKNIVLILMIVSIIIIFTLIVTLISRNNINPKKPVVDEEEKISIATSDRKLTMDNGLELTFGQILALGGDIFATNMPICDGKTLIDRQKLFMDAFNTLNNEDNKWSNGFGSSATQVPGVLDIFDKEIKRIRNASLRGVLPSKAYADAGHQDDEDYNIATGGGKGTKEIAGLINIKLLELIPEGRYMQLAELNWDHFAPQGCSWKTYTAGHTLAMKKAANATTDKDLDRAYAIEAFACHFLSDHFASGHLRSPRKILQTGHPDPSKLNKFDLIKYKSHPWNSTIGGYMSKMMHDEDNANGLWVQTNAYSKDKSGPGPWLMFGDGSYANPDNVDNRERQKQTLQASINDVWMSHKNKEPISNSSKKIWEMLPDLEVVDDDPRNAPPMFKLENGLITKRQNNRTRTPVVSQVGTVINFTLNPYHSPTGYTRPNNFMLSIDNPYVK